MLRRCLSWLLVRVVIGRRHGGSSSRVDTIAEVPQMRALQPQLIGHTFRNIDPLARTKWTTVTGFAALGSVATLVLLILAGSLGVLFPEGGTPWSIGVMIHGAPGAHDIQTPLSLDPTAWLIVAAACLTPLFCAQQVKAIRRHVRDTAENMKRSGQRPTSTKKINDAVDRANICFRRVGYLSSSIAIFTGAFGASLGLYVQCNRYGLMASWGPSDDKETWSERVREGWWANWDTHLWLGVSLVAFGTYLFYFLFKQVAMGAIFARFANRTRSYFGITPNLRFNSDGYWGLRALRAFMAYTYASTLIDFLAALGMFTLWLPFNWWSVIALYIVIAINSFVVFFPSIVARNSVIFARRRYVESLTQVCTLDDRGLPDEATASALKKLWNAPNLPFRTRSAFTAVGVYLLAPTALLVVGSLLPG